MSKQRSQSALRQAKGRFATPKTFPDCPLFSRYDWILRRFPGVVATLQSRDLLEACLLELERRTGAGFFGRSGTVGDDGLVLGKAGQRKRKLSQGNAPCSRKMAGGISAGADIENDHFAGVDLALQILW